MELNHTLTSHDGAAYLSTVDYIVFILVISVTFAIAIWTSLKSKNTTQDFFTASKSIGIIPVAMSVLSTFTNSIFLLSYSGEVYGYGLELSVVMLGGATGIITFTFMYLRVFYDLKVSTVYEYFELRYQSGHLRRCLTTIQLTSESFLMGISLYGPSLIMSAVTPLDAQTYIIIFGILCALYATIGGMRGVIWTDAFMLVIIIFGLITVVIVGCSQISITEMWKIAEKGGRTTIFNFNPSLYQRQNSYSIFLFSFLNIGIRYGGSQQSLQRVNSAKSFKLYKRSLIMIVICYLVVTSLVFTAGLVTYATYAGCDPLTQGKIKKIDQILPYFVNDKLGHMRGLSGLFLASMICAAISTITSAMNAVSNLVYSDFLLQISSIKKLSERSSTIICKSITLFLAAPAIGIAIFISTTGSLMQTVGTILGTITGPLHGIYFLALIFPTSNLIGVIVGYFSSLGFIVWFLIGRFVYKSKQKHLPLNADFCNYNGTNFTFLDSEFPFESTSTTPAILEASDDTSMYDVTYTFYKIFGTIVCILVGICVSHITGGRRSKEVREELISPFSRWLFYKQHRRKEEQTEMKEDYQGNSQAPS